VQQRTVICESSFFWSWPFLYNNLHLIHTAVRALCGTSAR
jgi:hypothetical protein